MPIEYMFCFICREQCKKSFRRANSQGQNFYKLKYISLEEVKIVPFQ